MTEVTIRRDQVVNIINSVIEKVEAAEDVSREQLYQELQALHDLIEETRREISETHVGDVAGKHIPTATDELDAVVKATEVATSAIMDSCDEITSLSAKAPTEVESQLMNEVTKILEACSFQDITGQRISKVVKNLKIIDEKVTNLIGILQDKIPGLPMESDGADKRVGDARLLNGPQMPDKAVNQDDIDKLLADLF
jgi:chemotaxis protein CheZ